VRQPTQLPALVRQNGVAPVHSAALVAEHWPQAPDGWHAGVVPEHSPSPAQPRQLWNAGSHLGVEAGQSVSARHATQLPLDARQSGRVPVHCVVLLAEHWPHAPDGWHAGVVPEHSPSPAQPRHVCATTLHTGVAPPHSAFDTQFTHVPEATLHAGMLPVHRVVLLAEQTPHEPFGWHAGVAPPPHSPSPVQPRQVWLA
jgi:hypothetical protein